MFYKKIISELKRALLSPGHYGLVRTLKFNEIIAIHERTLNQKSSFNNRRFGFYTPFLFHGTSYQNALNIIEGGWIEPRSEQKGITSLTDIDFTQMERLRMSRFDIAFAFHRDEIAKSNPSLNQAFIFNPELKSLFEAAKTELAKHSDLPELKKFLQKIDQYHPSSDIQIDLHEYRVTENIEIRKSLWILINPNDFKIGKLDRRAQEILDMFSQKYGGIAYSLWDADHQTDLLSEAQYGIFKFKKSTGLLIGLNESGEYYVQKDPAHFPLYEKIKIGKIISTPEIKSRNEYNLQRSNTTNYRYLGYENTTYERLNETDETFEIHAWPLSHYQLARMQHYILKNYADDLLTTLAYERLIDYPQENLSYQKIKSQIEK